MSSASAVQTDHCDPLIPGVDEIQNGVDQIWRAGKAGIILIQTLQKLQELLCRWHA